MMLDDHKQDARKAEQKAKRGRPCDKTPQTAGGKDRLTCFHSAFLQLPHHRNSAGMTA